LRFERKLRVETPIQFHWSPLPDEGSRDAARFVDLCHCAEASGFASVHVPVTSCLSDALALATVAGIGTNRVRFRIGWGVDGVLASRFGREMKEAWTTLQGRLIFHMSFGSEDAARNGHFGQAVEFLANCRQLFNESEFPEFDVEGETAEAAFLAIKQANCLWRLPNRPDQVYADALPILHFGKRVGLLSSVIAREARQEALDAAALLLRSNTVERRDGPSSWLTPYLWTGLVSGWPGRTTAFVGSFEEVARSIHGFKKNGILQFLIRDWPDEQEIFCSATRILSLIREMEADRVAIE
jgi:alkanesulfonate monooxygenase SsuD/methylene tetrahydromethanopterin reductase-like flavin-dependent oxidoreductase (luciferase family)